MIYGDMSEAAIAVGLARNARAQAPYALTLGEYKRRELDRAREAVRPREAPRVGKFYLYSPRERRRLDEAARTFEFVIRPGVLEEAHRHAVAEALGAGKQVDERVLAEYPDLAGRAPKRTTLSRAIDRENARHEPPGGFGDADLVDSRNADTTVASIIRDQLGRVTLAMLGAHDLVAWPDGLQFAIKGSPKKVTRIGITLAPDDTYTVTFYRGRGVNIAKVAEFEGVYVDQLHDVIEEETGLYATMHRRQAPPGRRDARRPPVGYLVRKIDTDPPMLYRVERDNGGVYLLLQPVDEGGNAAGEPIQDRRYSYERMRRARNVEPERAPIFWPPRSRAAVG